MNNFPLVLLCTAAILLAVAIGFLAGWILGYQAGFDDRASGQDR